MKCDKKRKTGFYWTRQHKIRLDRKGQDKTKTEREKI